MQEILEILDDLSLIIHPKIEGKLPRYKQYLSASRGVLYQDIWAFQPGTRGLLWNSTEGIDEDVKWLDNEPERVDYPTQKPLGLLSRIIRSSSNEGDMVLDPFCGCATTPVAAEKLNRQWVGIDISPKAAELVKVRMERETNLLDQFNPIVRTDIPKRTDVGKLPPYKTHRHTLYGKQVLRGLQASFPVPQPDRGSHCCQVKGGGGGGPTIWTTCSCCAWPATP